MSSLVSANIENSRFLSKILWNDESDLLKKVSQISTIYITHNNLLGSHFLTDNLKWGLYENFLTSQPQNNGSVKHYSVTQPSL